MRSEATKEEEGAEEGDEEGDEELRAALEASRVQVDVDARRRAEARRAEQEQRHLAIRERQAADLLAYQRRFQSPQPRQGAGEVARGNSGQ